MTELKPCPFCGGNAKTREFLSITGLTLKQKKVYYVECVVCRIRTMVELGADVAIEAWNRRAEDGKKTEHL